MLLGRQLLNQHVPDHVELRCAKLLQMCRAGMDLSPADFITLRRGGFGLMESDFVSSVEERL